MVCPAHVVHEWFGHTARISDKHYTEANETHYEMLRVLTETADNEASSIYRQSGMFSKCSQSCSQQASEQSGNIDTAESRESGTIQHDVVPSGIEQKRGMGDTGLCNSTKQAVVFHGADLGADLKTKKASKHSVFQDFIF